MRWYTTFGKCIYTSPSGYKVYENFFYRWLTLNSHVLQTAINKINPQRPVLYYLPAITLMARTIPDDICLLGLGGAGIPHLLASHPSTITAVDNSEEILKIAQQFFMIDKLAHLKLIHQPAELYLENNTIQYGHLIVDIYNAQTFPPECNNEHFFLHCKKGLKPTGFLTINLANSKEQYEILQLIKKHFLNTLIIPIRKCANIVIIASNHPKNEFINLIMMNKQLKKISFISPWGYVAQIN